MTIEKSPLPGADLPDGTAQANDPGSIAGQAFTTADLKRGYLLDPVERTSPFDPDTDGGATSVGNPFTYGGFLGRPQGTAR